ncbi:double-strand break repair protein AddB [Aestuariispira ectoiniformans]|uniref:double-strand break repair protein AddB n=1 Tax=Aestuariispira ectoiniformans TaxID=2775080 RepID=UPI00223BC923|nr:double-strand break repair protein AddB [Aestuariispira ectoiniformans]
MARVLNISRTRSFVDALAAGLLAEVGDDPLALADITILLPTRRACRALREAFLRLGEGKAMVLPTMRPVGDVDEEELLLAGAGSAELGDFSLEQPPAINGLRRELLLTRLIMARPIDPERGQMPTPDQAARLARELARLLDQVQVEGQSLDNIENLVRSEFSEHWQQTVDFLDILRVHWPVILDAEGCLDPADRRNRVMRAQALAWEAQPPKGRLIAAGSTGSVPATADLLAVIAALPNGEVVLPGLDRDLDDAAWDQVRFDETHPQFGLAGLLARMNVARDAVADWPTGPGEGQTASSLRAQLATEALRPAATTDAWRNIHDVDPAALDGVSRIDCPTAHIEATAIALIMRQGLETASQTTALVTPDRTLARRVAAELKRWGVQVDDSAGVPLHIAPPAVMLRLLAEAAALNLSPVALLALCKHPLVAGGEEIRTFRRQVRRLEEKLLRGPRPGPGLAGIRAVLEQRRREEKIRPERAEQLADFLGRLEDLLRPLVAVMARETASLEEMLDAHLQVAEALCATDGDSGSDRLWAGEAGEALVVFLADLREHADLMTDLRPRDYPTLLDSLLIGQTVRPRYGQHPRLFIWGPLEARLQRADVTILGGLNEGIWPPEAKADPWMSRPMKQAMGLPLPERRSGVTAHDFELNFCARRVILTRADKVDGQPTVPSRWLSRLDVVLDKAGLKNALQSDQAWIDWAHDLGRAKGLPAAMPEPRPPVEARPRRLSVTRVEAWMRDPYTIFAQKILNLSPLDPLEMEPGMAERGTFIHDALEKFVKAFPHDVPVDAEQQLLQIGEDCFGAALGQPSVRAFWWPRFRRIAQWFVTLERDRRKQVAKIFTEIWGRLEMMGPAGAFEVSAKADRLDQLGDGTFAIVDYKTGSPPSDKTVKAGIAPQLPLEAAIAAAGGFDGIGEVTVSELAFWQLSGGDPAGKESPVRGDPMELAQVALDGLRELVTRFDDPATAYRPTPRPKFANRYNDYEHLAREKEWRVTGGEDAE